MGWIVEENPSHKRATDNASKWVHKPRGVGKLAGLAQQKIRANDRVFKALRKDLDLMLRLSKAWATGKYKDVSISSLLIVVGAILYLLDPLDVIPDFVPLLGLTDDASVFALAIGRIKSELNKFEDWENEITIK